MKKLAVLTLCLALLVQACNPYPTLNHTTTYTSDGSPNTVTDSRGVTRYTYDSRGNLARTLQPNGQVVNYTYDLIGNRSSMTTSAGTINYDYDAANQLTEVTGPNNAVTTFAYDNIGLRTQEPSLIVTLMTLTEICMIIKVFPPIPISTRGNSLTPKQGCIV